MLIRDLYLPEFDHEAAATRRLLEVFPEGKLDWRPHPKSMTLQQLVSHLVNLPSWMPLTLSTAELDFAANADWKTPQLSTTAEILATFDAHVAQARAALAEATDEQMAELWTLRAGETVYFTQPKFGVLRGFVLSHLVHHRAQYGVYLRLMEVPLPGVYGPSADEAM